MKIVYLGVLFLFIACGSTSGSLKIQNINGTMIWTSDSEDSIFVNSSSWIESTSMNWTWVESPSIIDISSSNQRIHIESVLAWPFDFKKRSLQF